MPSKIVTTHELGQALLNGYGQYLMVLPAFSLRWSGDTVIASGAGNRITNQGFIVSGSENPVSEASAVSFTGQGGSLDNSGTISGLDGAGVELGGGAFGDNWVSNRGAIFGTTEGILVTGSSNSIANSGTIEGADRGISGVSEGFARIFNTGLIQGRFIGVDFNDNTTQGSLFIENSGTIGSAGRAAIWGSRGRDEILNAGSMLGDVRLFGGADFYDGRLGRVTGLVDGQEGSDTIWGGTGGETLRGGDGDDEILGAGGNDVIEGGAGSDLLDGGEGVDLVSFASQEQPVLVDLANATLNLGDAAEDTFLNFEGVIGGSGNDTLRGDVRANALRGGSGDDVLDGRAGSDTMVGGAGNDLMLVDNAGDRIIEGIGQGADTVTAAVSYQLTANAEVEFLVTPDMAALTALNLTGSNRANTLIGNAGANRLAGRDGADMLQGEGGVDTLNGGNDNDTLLGGAANDLLYGDAGADSLLGGDGNDRLWGGDGNDVLSGGAGLDHFLFDTRASFDLNLLVYTNRDTITDFNPVEDKIRLSLAAYSQLGATGMLQADAFLSVAGGQATTTSQRIIYDPTTGIIWYDFNGSALSIGAQIAVLENRPANVTAADFVIIA